jgi:hypothetical protein
MSIWKITRFKLCKINRLKFFFSLWFPTSRARSWNSTSPAFCTAFFPLLDFSGSVGFGTWRIFVPLFWACRLFCIFLLFWISKRFCLWILYTLFTLVLLWHRVFYGCSFHTLFYPLSFRDKKGEYVSFWTGNVFLTSQVFSAKTLLLVPHYIAVNTCVWILSKAGKNSEYSTNW